MSATVVFIELATTTLIYLIAIYYAAFSYRLEWMRMVGVIVVASIIKAYLNKFLLLITPMGKTQEGELISIAIGTVLLYGISALSVLAMLAYRFSLFSAVGLSILSGFVLYLVKKIG
jgi:hypothetical protein